MRRGFTLVEIVVVVALLAIVSGVVAPALISATREDDTTRGAAELRTLLERARLTAVERGVPVVATIAPAAGAYRIELAASDSLLEAGLLALPQTVRLYAAAPVLRIRFDPLGTADADSVTVNGTARSRVVCVDPWTGAVSDDAP